MLTSTTKIFSPSRISNIFLPFEPPLKNGDKNNQKQYHCLPVSVILRIVDLVLGDPGRITCQSQYMSYMNLCDKSLSSSRAFQVSFLKVMSEGLQIYHIAQTYCTCKCIGTTYISGIEGLEHLLKENPFLSKTDNYGARIQNGSNQLVLDLGNLFKAWLEQLPDKLKILLEAMMLKTRMLSMPFQQIVLPKRPNKQLHTLTLHVTRLFTTGGGSLVSNRSSTVSNNKDFLTCFPNIQHLYLTGHPSPVRGDFREGPIPYHERSSVQDVHLDGSFKSLQFVLNYKWVMSIFFVNMSG